MEQNKKLLLKHLQLSFDDVTKETFEEGLAIGKGDEFKFVNACLNAIDEALNMHIVSQSLMNKRWAESRERTAQVREQVAIEKFIEIYWDEEYTPTFEEINKRLKLH